MTELQELWKIEREVKRLEMKKNEVVAALAETCNVPPGLTLNMSTGKWCFVDNGKATVVDWKEWSK